MAIWADRTGGPGDWGREVPEPVIRPPVLLRIPDMSEDLRARNPGSGTRTPRVRAMLSGFVGTPGPVVSVLAWVGAALLVLSATIHLHLWSQSYQRLTTIGPLFLVQGIAGIVLAVVVAVFRRLVVLAAGAIFALGTIAGLLLSVYVGLFGFRDSLSAPYATTSLVIEAVAFGVLAVSAVLTVALHREAFVHGRPTSLRAG